MLFRKRRTLTFPKTIIFAGNGCLRGGWDLVTQAVNNIYHGELDNEQFDKSLFLITAADISRMYIEQCLDFKSDEMPNQIWPDDAFKVREMIGKLYDKEFYLNKIPQYIEERLYNYDTFVITTNWDSTFWSIKKIKNLCQIHGRAKYPESLIFPTEYVRDAKLTLKRISEIGQHRNINPNFERFIQKRFRFLQSAEDLAYEWMYAKSVEEIIFWGIHLHDYDLEVMDFLFHFETTSDWLGFSPRYQRLSKLVIANLNNAQRLEKRISNIFRASLTRGCKLEILNSFTMK